MRYGGSRISLILPTFTKKKLVKLKKKSAAMLGEWSWIPARRLIQSKLQTMANTSYTNS